MKYLLIWTLLMFSVSGFAQDRVFNLRYISTNVSPTFEGKMPAKGDPKVIITDSTFIQSIQNDKVVYTITKKVNDNYFKASDGIKDYIITVRKENIGRWKHAIKIESGNDVTTYLSID